jgi:hypothetical protein
MSTLPFAYPAISFDFIPPGVNGAAGFSSAVRNSLIKQGYPTTSATGLANVYGSAYSFLKNNWSQFIVAYKVVDAAKTGYDAFKGTEKVIQSTTLITDATAMGASSEVLSGLSDARLAGGAGILSALVSVMEIVAKDNHIELNECALSVAKVSLDLIGLVSGGITVEFGIGGVLTAMSIVAGVTDTIQLASSCKLPGR